MVGTSLLSMPWALEQVNGLYDRDIGEMQCSLYCFADLVGLII